MTSSQPRSAHPSSSGAAADNIAATRAFWDAMSAHDLPAIEQALAQGADVDALAPANGWHAVHRAVFDERLDIALALLAHGVDLDLARDAAEPSALFRELHATAQLLQDPARMPLLNQQALNAPDAVRTVPRSEVRARAGHAVLPPPKHPLHRAIDNADAALIGWLMAHGADPRVRNDQGKTAVERIAEQRQMVLDTPGMMPWLPANQPEVDQQMQRHLDRWTAAATAFDVEHERYVLRALTGESSHLPADHPLSSPTVDEPAPGAPGRAPPQPRRRL